MTEAAEGAEDLSGPTRDEPLPSSWTVKRARDAYLEENGFTVESYDAPRTPASFLGIRFSVPNTPRHRWAIMLHDLHHVATGYGTDPRGEGELSAWECRRGLRPLGLYVGLIVISGVLLGLITAPRRTLRAWQASTGGLSLFHETDHSYEELLCLKTGDLRRLLELPVSGLSDRRRGLHSLAPGR